MSLYFEDLDVGDQYEAGAYTIDADEIVSFAEQFDPQPFHTDPEAAADSMFGGLVASGLHTLSLSVRLFVTGFVNAGPELRNMGGLGMDDLQWHEPVRPGDTLRIEVEVVETTPSESREDRGYVEFQRRTYTETDHVLTVHSYNIVRRRGVDTDPEDTDA
ncbi:MaoC family dehydratase [Natronomonas sp.]|uniref:MaoC family dehydratase n=1 Tax=Natronomonas sp. TaxID=2184060 RepID=UPI002603C026|nr:MaoC family dehydratase [Natronomonas sp.]